VASGVSAADYAGGFSSAWLDFTKGLGAPVGACLAGSAAFIEEAWRFKQMMGGSLRQAGIVAAAGLYALEHNVERLAEDHENARVLAEGLSELPGATIDASKVETNIVIFEVADPAGVIAAARDEGVELTQMGPGRIRAVTHLDVDRAGIERALEVLRKLLG
jgi:threonine aldolase